jgi:hypothetical protein
MTGALFLGVQCEPGGKVATADSEMAANPVRPRSNVFGTPLVEGLLRDLQQRTDLLSALAMFRLRCRCFGCVLEVRSSGSPSCLPARWPARFLVHGRRADGRHDLGAEAFRERFHLSLDLLGRGVELIGRALYEAGAAQERELSANRGRRSSEARSDLATGRRAVPQKEADDLASRSVHQDVRHGETTTQEVCGTCCCRRVYSSRLLSPGSCWKRLAEQMISRDWRLRADGA